MDDSKKLAIKWIRIKNGHQYKHKRFSAKTKGIELMVSVGRDHLSGSDYMQMRLEVEQKEVLWECLIQIRECKRL